MITSTDNNTLKSSKTNPTEKLVKTLAWLSLPPASVPEGIDIVIQPWDEDGNLMNIEGRISVILWADLQTDPEADNAIKGKILREWQDVPVLQSEFEDGGGTWVLLPYDDDFWPSDFGQGGILQIALKVGATTTLSEEEPLLLRLPEDKCC